ncbi:MBG domain-containing protein, partial [Arthrospira platensis SPKY1]|nr:MBG domain-containing protein [Arthrospira platensis SPKY1]
MNLVQGDTFTGGLTRPLGEDVGHYAIGQGSLAIGNGRGGNYDLRFTSRDLTITERPITLTAVPVSKIYGNSNPALAVTVDATSQTSLAAGDSI